jgi:hypothetical protein
MSPVLVNLTDMHPQTRSHLTTVYQKKAEHFKRTLLHSVLNKVLKLSELKVKHKL